MHPSDTVKTAIGDIIGALVLAFTLNWINEYTVEDYVVACVSFTLVLFAGNMAIALPLRHSLNTTVSRSLGTRMVAAAAVIVCSLMILGFDFASMLDLVSDFESERVDAVAMLVTMLVWIAGYVVAWRPFLMRRENGFVSACVSLILGGLSMALFFLSLIAGSVFGATSQEIQAMRFAFACVTFATAVSSFMNQWSVRQQTLRVERLDADDRDTVDIGTFDPFEDLATAERYATVGMHLDTYTRNGLESWLYGRYCMCEAIARSTHFYGAYEGKRLVGFLLADMHGQRKPYRHSRFALFYHFVGALFVIFDRGGADDAYDRVNEQMLATIDPAPDAELVYFASDPDLVGKGIGSKLLAAFERDFAGKRVFLYTDDGCTYQFYDHRGFTRAATKTVEADAPGGHFSMDCMIYTKQL